METPKVRNVNTDKRRKRKHHYSQYDPIVFKWWGKREYGFVLECTMSSDGFAQYDIRSTSHIGAIYRYLELDDPIDPYCYVSSVLTKSINPQELEKIKEHIERYKRKFKIK
jgi:hypothetical protein